MQIEAEGKCLMEPPVDAFIEDDNLIVIDRYDHRMECPCVYSILHQLDDAAGNGEQKDES